MRLKRLALLACVALALLLCTVSVSASLASASALSASTAAAAAPAAASLSSQPAPQLDEDEDMDNFGTLLAADGDDDDDGIDFDFDDADADAADRADTIADADATGDEHVTDAKTVSTASAHSNAEPRTSTRPAPAAAASGAGAGAGSGAGSGAARGKSTGDSKTKNNAASADADVDDADVLDALILDAIDERNAEVAAAAAKETEKTDKGDKTAAKTDSDSASQNQPSKTSGSSAAATAAKPDSAASKNKNKNNGKASSGGRTMEDMSEDELVAMLADTEAAMARLTSAGAVSKSQKSAADVNKGDGAVKGKGGAKGKFSIGMDEEEEQAMAALIEANGGDFNLDGDGDGDSSNADGDTAAEAALAAALAAEDDDDSDHDDGDDLHMDGGVAGFDPALSLSVSVDDRSLTAGAGAVLALLSANASSSASASVGAGASSPSGGSDKRWSDAFAATALSAARVLAAVGADLPPAATLAVVAAPSASASADGHSTARAANEKDDNENGKSGMDAASAVAAGALLAHTVSHSNAEAGSKSGTADSANAANGGGANIARVIVVASGDVGFARACASYAALAGAVRTEAKLWPQRNGKGNAKSKGDDSHKKSAGNALVNVTPAHSFLAGSLRRRFALALAATAPDAPLASAATAAALTGGGVEAAKLAETVALTPLTLEAHLITATNALSSGGGGGGNANDGAAGKDGSAAAGGGAVFLGDADAVWLAQPTATGFGFNANTGGGTNAAASATEADVAATAGLLRAFAPDTLVLSTAQLPAALLITTHKDSSKDKDDKSKSGDKPAAGAHGVVVEEHLITQRITNALAANPKEANGARVWVYRVSPLALANAHTNGSVYSNSIAESGASPSLAVAASRAAASMSSSAASAAAAARAVCSLEVAPPPLRGAAAWAPDAVTVVFPRPAFAVFADSVAGAPRGLSAGGKGAGSEQGFEFGDEDEEFESRGRNSIEENDDSLIPFDEAINTEADAESDPDGDLDAADPHEGDFMLEGMMTDRDEDGDGYGDKTGVHLE